MITYLQWERFKRKPYKPVSMFLRRTSSRRFFHWSGWLA
jgi:hypothetical protein